MTRTKVGVLRGGPSSEYEVSLKTGSAILKNLADPRIAEKYEPMDIFIDRDGAWHISGAPVAPHEAIRRADVFVNALHGEFGEDGKLQSLLDQHDIAYTGSRSLASALGMNKALSKEAFKKSGIKTPHYIVITDRKYNTVDIFKSFPMPAVVKPVSAGSSVGISIVRAFADLEPAIEAAFAVAERNCDDQTPAVLIEEFISGVEATVGVIDGFRGEEIYALPPIEIRHSRDFFDYAAKYSSPDAKDGRGRSVAAEEIVPGRFSDAEKAELIRLAREVHAALGLRHYSRTDFIVSPRRGVYVLEVNTLPGLTEASLMPKALLSVGSSLPEFIDHIIGLALEGK
jgi:D-alanine-D-alanine ligase